MSFVADRAYANQCDQQDTLKKYSQNFYMPKAQSSNKAIYLVGHSLGLQPKGVQAAIEKELQDWQQYGVEGHFVGDTPWLPYHEFVAEPLADVVGAKPIEVVAMNSLTVNLHLMMVSFYRPTKERHKIVIEKGAFPSDCYATASQIRFHGFDPKESLIELAPRQGEHTLRHEDILETIEREGKSIALVMLPGVQYYTGQAFRMQEITAMAHKQGAFAGFDLAHAAGNLHMHLHDWQVDFAVWCSYKYLNSGPGGIAGCFVHEKHANNFELPRFAGWWGNNKERRFLMLPTFEPLAGAEGWQLSNPPIFQLASLKTSLEIFSQATMPALRKKSTNLTNYLEFLLIQKLGDSITLITPTDNTQRGCQLSLSINGVSPTQGKAVYDKLLSKGVFCDWREPAVIRVAPTPLYNTYEDVYDFVDILKDCNHDN